MSEHLDCPMCSRERELELLSGKIPVRMPRHIHRDLIQMARRDGVSLNLFVTMLLAEYVGRREAE